MIEFTINKEEHIKSIIEKFDFEKVNKIMTILDWRWVNNNMELSIPTSYELKEESIRILNDVYDSDMYSVSTGGLKASKFEDHLELEFIINHSSSQTINYEPIYEKIKKNKNRNKKLNIIQKLNEDENN